MAGEKSKILIIGGTGKLGKFMVEASLKAGHPTFVLIRESTASDAAKSCLVHNFQNAGAVLLPSEFGCDVDRAKALSPAAESFEKKVKIRRMVEAQGIPYTYVCCYGFAGYSLPTLAQDDVKAPPDVIF